MQPSWALQGFKERKVNQVMNTADRQVGFPKDRSQETIEKSLDRLGHKYQLALQEWQQISKLVLEKDVPQPLGSSKHLPKRLPKQVTLNDNIGSVPLEQVMRKKLVNVLSQCRIQEMQVRAMEKTLEDHTGKLESERNQQLSLQHQRHTVLQKKEELQKLAQKLKTDLQKEAPVAEIAERALAENAERLAKIDEEVVKIRRDAIHLLQVYQVRSEVQGQVETFSSRITALEENKTKALERMSCLQGEEATLSQNMNATVRKVCAQQEENGLELGEKYCILWSNVDLLVGFCDKLLQMTRPEAEALKLNAYQTGESNGVQPFILHSQDEIRENHSKVTSTDTQCDVVVSQTQPPLRDITQHEDVSQVVESFTGNLIKNVHDENGVVSIDNDHQFCVENAAVHWESIACEGHHEGDNVADKQELESAEVKSVANFTEIQSKHQVPDQNKFELNTHYVQELLIERPSAVLTPNEQTNEITGNSYSPAFHDNNCCNSLEIQSEHEISYANTSVNFAEEHHTPVQNNTEKLSLSKHSDLHEPVVIHVVSNEVAQASIALPVAHQNDQTIIEEGTLPQVCNTGSTSLSISNFSLPCRPHVSTSSPLHTTCTFSHIKTRMANEKADPTHRAESKGDENAVVVLKVADENEVDASGNQAECSPSLAIEQKKSDSMTSASHVMEHKPDNTITVLTEEHSPQVSSLYPDTLNPLAAGELAADCISSTDKLNTASVLISFNRVDERSMTIPSSEKQHEKVVEVSKQIFDVSSVCITSEQSDKRSAESASQLREYNTHS